MCSSWSIDTASVLHLILLSSSSMAFKMLTGLFQNMLENLHLTLINILQLFVLQSFVSYGQLLSICCIHFLNDKLFSSTVFKMLCGLLQNMVECFYFNLKNTLQLFIGQLFALYGKLHLPNIVFLIHTLHGSKRMD